MVRIARRIPLASIRLLFYCYSIDTNKIEQHARACRWWRQDDIGGTVDVCCQSGITADEMHRVCAHDARTRGIRSAERDPISTA